MAKNQKPAKEKAGRRHTARKADDIPSVIVPDMDAKALITSHGSFDLEDPVLPDWVEERALGLRRLPL